MKRSVTMRKRRIYGAGVGSALRRGWKKATQCFKKKNGTTTCKNAQATNTAAAAAANNNGYNAAMAAAKALTAQMKSDNEKLAKVVYAQMEQHRKNANELERIITAPLLSSSQRSNSTTRRKPKHY